MRFEARPGAARSRGRVRGRAVAVPVALLALVFALVLAACGGAASPAPSTPPSPSPGPTPDPHLTEPATVDAVFRALDAAGLHVKANNADGSPEGEPRKRINATYAGWPLILMEFSSSEQLRKAGRFDPAAAPRAGDPPYAFAGLNILVEYGPRVPTPFEASPEPRFHAAALGLILVLDPLLGPLEQRSIDPLPLRGAVPPSAAPSPSS